MLEKIITKIFYFFNKVRTIPLLKALLKLTILLVKKNPKNQYLFINGDMIF